MNYCNVHTFIHVHINSLKSNKNYINPPLAMLEEVKTIDAILEKGVIKVKKLEETAKSRDCINCTYPPTPQKKMIDVHVTF